MKKIFVVPAQPNTTICEDDYKHPVQFWLITIDVQEDGRTGDYCCLPIDNDEISRQGFGVIDTLQGEF